MVGNKRMARLGPLARWPLAVLLGVALAGCGGGGGGSAAPAPAPPPPDPGPGQVTISGTVTYDFVPAGPFGGLDYGAIEQRPARLVTVQFIDGSVVLASTLTDSSGNYSLIVDEETSGFVRVRAESVETGTPGWNFRVVDNTSNDAIYTLDGAVASSGTTSSTRDLRADSGWTGIGNGYGNERAAAPFAILDTVYEAVELLLAADPAIQLPPLVLHWSPDNKPVYGVDGNPDPATGEIGTSFYSENSLNGTIGIYLLGAEDEDTEEYDRHVILHEFAHYLARQLGRSDTIGGPHAFGDRVDLRVAFSEGWATAFSALALDDPQYRDTVGPDQMGVYSFSVESAGFNPAPGWYSEYSVLQLVYDLVDSGADAGDGLIYPFADVWSAMTGAMVTTPALTSIFPLLNAIKSAHPGDAMLIDQLAAAQQIDSVTDDFGSGETNDAGSADVVPIFTPITVGNANPVNLCSSDDFSSPVTGSKNKLASRRYLRFTPPPSTQVTITVQATSIPAGEFADPDFWLRRQGQLVDPSNFPAPPKGQGPPSATCQDVNGGGWTPSTCVESATFFLGNTDEHVLEIYEWTNTNADDDPDYPPIGRTCFDVTVM